MDYLNVIQFLGGHEGFLDAVMPKGWRTRVNPVQPAYNQGEQPMREHARDEGRGQHLDILAEGISSSPQSPRLELIA